MTLKPILASSVFAVSTLLTSTAFAEKSPDFSITTTNVYNGSSKIEDTNTELKRDIWMISADSNFELAPKWKLGVSVGYETENFDWGNSSSFIPNSSQSSVEAWDKVQTVKASVTISHFLNQNWILSATPLIQSSYADGLSMSDAHSYGIVTSGLYRFESGNMVGVGIAYLNDLNKVRTTPYLAVKWKINEKWSLGNPFKSDFSGPAGLELSYLLNENISFGFGGSLKRERFLVSGKDISAEIEETVAFARATWSVTKQLKATAYLGYNTNGTLEYSHNLGKSDLDSHAAGALSITYKF